MEDLGYRVNLIAPWVMDTPMSKSLADLNRKHGFPVGDANDVAKAVIRCAVDDDICGKLFIFYTLTRFLFNPSSTLAERSISEKRLSNRKLTPSFRPCIGCWCCQNLRLKRRP